jgi:thiopurine S-methyltransferase
MKLEFWKDRWDAGRIQFHQRDVHPILCEFGSAALEAGGHTLVPLCGKSLDMLWLAERSRVTGVEFVEQAVHDFFAENGLKYEKSGAEYAAGRIRLICGDMLAVTPEQAGPVDFIYDRAALVALPPDLRKHYAAKLIELSGPPTTILLISFEYAAPEELGPPFSVSETEIRDLFDAEYFIERAKAEDGPALNERFRAAGVNAVRECAYLLKRRAEPRAIL